jgi:tRNA pseudouridine55 synthase
VDGVLVVDKPSGPTSHDVVAAARRALREKSVGHTGTLDPFATGLLALCLGRATRLARFLTVGAKTYDADVRLGFETTTDDRVGKPVGEAADPGRVTDAQVAAACAALTGRIAQVPPAYSAKHVDGKRAYDLAREGAAPELAPVTVEVQELEVVGRPAADRLRLRVVCSPGTYVRALARDLGRALAVGAHLDGLRRTGSGTLTLDQAVAYPSFEGWADRVLPMATLLPEMPGLRLGEEAVRYVRAGRDLEPRQLGGEVPSAERVRLLDEAGQLLALAVRRGPKLHADVVFA